MQKTMNSSVEPLFYCGRGITASDAVFTIIWHGFSTQKKNFFTTIFFYYNGDIGGRLASAVKKLSRYDFIATKS